MPARWLGRRKTAPFGMGAASSKSRRFNNRPDSTRRTSSAEAGSGARHSTIIFREILPNVMPSVLVFIPIIVALAMLTESALSFLSIGVQPPSASWGTIINDGLALLYTRPLVALAPGLMIVLTAASLNLYGDAVRDALDPKTRARGDV